MSVSKSSVGVNMDRTCRICLDTCPIPQKMVALFDKSNVFEWDELPKNICTPCQNKLVEMCNFRELIEQSDAKLRKLLNNKEENVPNEYIAKTAVIQDSDKVDESKFEVIVPDVVGLNKIPSPERVPDVFTCSVCLKNYPTPGRLKAHFKSHGEKQESCPDCGKRFAYKRLLVQHQLTHQTTRAFHCSDCGSAFKTKGRLQVHSRRHFNIRPYPCKFCDKRFFQACHRDQHQGLHTGERSFACHICGKLLRNQPGLNGHLRSHEGTLPFNCGVCEKKFALKSSLRNHERLHAGQLPFGCDKCNKRFALESALKVHSNGHSEEAANICEFCGKQFLTERHLKEHALTHGSL